MNQKSSRLRDNHHSLALNYIPGGSTLDYRKNAIEALSSSMNKNIPIRNYLNLTYQSAQ
jgi:hypothetical protein